MISDSGREFAPQATPEQLCNLPRLIQTLAERNIDGIVALLGVNQYYLSSFGPHHSIPETTGMFPVIFSRHQPEHPILLMAEIDLARLKYQPTWIRDIRPYAISALPHVPPGVERMRRFVPADMIDNDSWGARGPGLYHPDAGSGVVRALQDLGLSAGTIAFDNFGMGAGLVAAALPGARAVPGEGLFRRVRSFKTPVEIDLLKQAAAINQTALERTVAAWTPAMTYQDVLLTYQIAALRLGGHPNLPDTVAMSNLPGLAFNSEHQIVDHPILEGSNIIFDCHGKFDGYCWDGGKTWSVGGQPKPVVRRNWRTTFDAAYEIQAAAKPGARVSDLVRAGETTFQKSGISSDGVLIYFHGLGLDHTDQEILPDERDWVVNDDMVFSTHICFPGDEYERLFLEEIVHVNAGGSERLFTWDESLLLG